MLILFPYTVTMIPSSGGLLLWLFAILSSVVAQATVPANSTSTSSSTSSTSTTPRPTAPPRQWDPNYYLGLTINRFWDSAAGNHHYVLDFNEMNWYTFYYPTALREESVGRVIPASLATEALSSCSGQLTKIIRYERNIGTRVSIFATSIPAGVNPNHWLQKEMFYCANGMGICGANYELAMFPSKQGAIGMSQGPQSYDYVRDLFYPSNWQQSNQMRMTGMGLWSRQGTPICYLWK